MTPKKIAGFLLTLTGALILLLGAWYAAEAVRFIGETESTTGVVVEHEFTHGLNSGFREVGSRGATQTTAMYAPIVEFDGAQGETVRFQANWSEGDPPEIGSEVGVRYRGERPSDARIAGIGSLFGASAIVVLIGSVFTGAGILMVRRQPPGN